MLMTADTEKPLSHAFPPIARSDAVVLILGSMPGAISLAQHQYYAHPRNAFWPAMSAILGADNDLDYKLRSDLLMDNRIAVWDVLQSCHRPGSLDSRIDMKSAISNNFEDFLARHPAIRNILFNGRKAESLFKRLALPTIDATGITLHPLPSTSPAMASMDLEAKTACWRDVLLPALAEPSSPP